MAQVRAVPVEVSAPVGGFALPTALSGTPLLLTVPSLPTASLNASVSLVPSLLPDNFSPAQLDAVKLAAIPNKALTLKAAVVASRPNIPLGTAPVKAITALQAALPAAALIPETQQNAKPQTETESLSALYDGAITRAQSPAAVPEGPEQPGARKPLLSPKTVRRAWRTAAVAVPVAVGAAVLGAAAPALALTVLHWLGQAAYWLANPFAFAFTLPQIHRMLTRRSADVSKGMLAVGFLSTAAMAVNMAFDGKDLMLYRNLAQAAGFGVMLYLQRRFTKKTDAPLPSKKTVWVQTAVAVAVMAAVLAAAGPLLAAVVPGIAAMGGLLVPFQIVSGFGFTYLMYAQLTKMQRDHSAGDSSPAMMWAYLGTKTIWLWSFATTMSLATGAPWLILSLGTLFIGLTWFAGQAALSRLLHAPWSFLPEKASFLGKTFTKGMLADGVAFVALSALILLLSGLGWLAFSSLLGVPAADSSRFVMYLMYTVQSLVACLATLRTLKMRAELDKK